MSTAGPKLLEERTLSGIFVHLFGPLFGVFLAGPLYLVSDREFTRENARHVLNWHLTVIGVVVALIFWIVSVEFVGISDALAILLFIPVFVAFAYVVPGTIIFAIIGTAKAVFGKPWKYPLAPEFVDQEDA